MLQRMGLNKPLVEETFLWSLSWALAECSEVDVIRVLQSIIADQMNLDKSKVYRLLKSLSLSHWFVIGPSSASVVLQSGLCRMTFCKMNTFHSRCTGCSAVTTRHLESLILPDLVENFHSIPH